LYEPNEKEWIDYRIRRKWCLSAMFAIQKTVIKN
jgi:hypothetical protein